VVKVSDQRGKLRSSYQDEYLTHFTVICEVKRTPEHNFDVLDALGHEIGSERSFGISQSFEPDGGKFTHLLDGKPYKVK